MLLGVGDSDDCGGGASGVSDDCTITVEEELMLLGWWNDGYDREVETVIMIMVQVMAVVE